MRLLLRQGVHADKLRIGDPHRARPIPSCLSPTSVTALAPVLASRLLVCLLPVDNPLVSF